MWVSHHTCLAQLCSDISLLSFATGHPGRIIRWSKGGRVWYVIASAPDPKSHTVRTAKTFPCGSQDSVIPADSPAQSTEAQILSGNVHSSQRLELQIDNYINLCPNTQHCDFSPIYETEPQTSGILFLIWHLKVKLSINSLDLVHTHSCFSFLQKEKM